MSQKIFKESLKKRRDGITYDNFVDKYCEGNSSYNRRTVDKDEAYELNYTITNVKTKDPGKIKYSDVCPSLPPIVPGLVIAIMNEIERRIPPLSNITVGYTHRNTNSDAILDSVIHNCKYVENIPFTLYLEPSSSLFQILQLFLQRLESPVFCVDLNLASNEKFYNFPMKYNYGSVSKVIQSLDLCLEKMRREQVALLAFIMQKIQLWTLKNVEHQLQKNPKLSKDQIYIESIDFFRSLLAPYLIGLPEAHLRAIELRKFQKGDYPSCQTANIFAIVTCDVSIDYWHSKSIEAYGVQDVELKRRPSENTLEKTFSSSRKMGFHWVPSEATNFL